MGLRQSDLEFTVDPVFEIDSYKSKMGDDEDIVVLSFSVNGEQPAKDLVNFVETGYNFVLDADKTSGEQADKKYRVSDLSCSTHPHNTYMELLSETGILGFLFIFLIFMILVYYSFKHFLLKFKGKFFFTDSQIALLSSVFINLWPLIPTGSFFNNWLNCLYYFPLGILLWSLLNNSTISKN